MRYLVIHVCNNYHFHGISILFFVCRDPTPGSIRREFDFKWPQVSNNDLKNLNYLDITSQFTPRVAPEAERLAFWDELYREFNGDSWFFDNSNSPHLDIRHPKVYFDQEINTVKRHLTEGSHIKPFDEVSRVKTDKKTKDKVGLNSKRETSEKNVEISDTIPHCELPCVKSQLKDELENSTTNNHKTSDVLAG